jgi:hypothetical protein
VELRFAEPLKPAGFTLRRDLAKACRIRLAEYLARPSL